MASLTILVDDQRLMQLQHFAAQSGLTVEEWVSQSIDVICTEPHEPDVRAMYPHLAKTFGPAGWNDPDMDSYNALDPRRHS